MQMHYTASPCDPPPYTDIFQFQLLCKEKLLCLYSVIKVWSTDEGMIWNVGLDYIVIHKCVYFFFYWKTKSVDINCIYIIVELTWNAWFYFLLGWRHVILGQGIRDYIWFKFRQIQRKTWFSPAVSLKARRQVYFFNRSINNDFFMHYIVERMWRQINVTLGHQFMFFSS